MLLSAGVIQVSMHGINERAVCVQLTVDELKHKQAPWIILPLEEQNPASLIHL